MNSEGQRGVYLTVEAKNEDENTFAWASGDVSLSPNAEILKLGAKRVFSMDSGTKLMVEPRYNFGKEWSSRCRPRSGKGTRRRE